MRFLLAMAALLAASHLHAFVAPSVGQPAPAFAVRDTTGKLVTLADFSDRTVVLEWTSPTCAAAQRLYADGALQAMQADAAARGVVWLTVLSARRQSASHLDAAGANALAEERELRSGHLLLDEAGTMARAYAVSEAPAFFVLGIDGRLAFHGGLGGAPSPDASAETPGGLSALSQALDAVLANDEPGITSTAVEGCALEL